jgi:hypothetical protein
MLKVIIYDDGTVLIAPESFRSHVSRRSRKSPKARGVMCVAGTARNGRQNGFSVGAQG